MATRQWNRDNQAISLTWCVRTRPRLLTLGVALASLFCCLTSITTHARERSFEVVATSGEMIEGKVLTTLGRPDINNQDDVAFENEYDSSSNQGIFKVTSTNAANVACMK
jgi:hypothetical protein